MDSDRNLFFTERTGYCIKQRDAVSGDVTVLAGICSSRGGDTGDDGTATSAQLNNPKGLFVNESTSAASLKRVTALY